MATTVALIESCLSLRQKLQDIIAASADCTCVCTCASWKAGLRELSRLRPDLIVMDVNLPAGKDLDGVARLKQLLPWTQILILSSCEKNEEISKALKAGARGYLLKRAASTELLQMVRNLLVTASR